MKLKEELLQLTDSDPERPRDSGTLADLCDIALDQGDFQRARAYAEQSLKAGGGARAAISFAELALREGDPNLAASFCADALRELEEGEFNYACALEIRGEAARRLADGSAAASFFGEGLRLFAELGDGGGAADCLDGLGRLAAEAGDVERAGRLVGAAEQLRETWGRLPIRADLPPLRVPAAARAEGMSMTLEEAVAYASEDPAVSSHA